MCRPPLGGDALGHVLLGVQEPRASAAPRTRGPGRWVGPRVRVRGQAGHRGLQRGGDDGLGLHAEAARGRRSTCYPGHLGDTHACIRAGGPTALHALPRSRPARLAAVRILSVTPWGPAHSGDCPGCSPPANLGYLSSLSSSPPQASALFVTPLYSSFLSVTFRRLRLGSACGIFSHLCCALTNFVNLRHCPSVSVTFRQFSPLSVPLRRPSAALGSSPSAIVYFRHSPSLCGSSPPHTAWRKPQGVFLPLDLFRHSPILLSLQSLVISGLPVTLSSSLHSWKSGLVSPERPLPSTRPD
ncbi:uncharacterized protein [Symphalangus syndactylus]|uniref:uncharacterized protein n=1 Tax=Symphalangus syndactylus TaxID=9590 RepID=UPI003003B37F